MKKLLLLASGLLFLSALVAQSSAFGVKGGLTVGVQQWGGFEQDPLLKYHGIAFIESYDPDEPFAVFAQLGYHQKGSAIRNRNYRDLSGTGFIRPPAREFIFNNLSLTLGAKQKFPLSGSTQWYWLLGVRGDYTLDTNLDEYNEINLVYPIYPLDSDLFIRDFNYGITFGAGIDFPIADLIGILLEFSVSPDLSYQYVQPAVGNVVDPYTGGTRVINERRIRNMVFEVTLGFRFLRLVEYVD
ncbi:MAG: outer membrane beta-barrel protein [Saprospiraceae bacterium]|nr:outer membrane beta-barrel protein [Lewinella sp.]